jgi:hypothetical protein
MKKLLILLAVVALAAAMPPKDTTGIAGVVTDAVTNQPIGYAQVGAAPRGGLTMTNQDGSYLIVRMHPGTYQVTAGAPGYEPGAYADSVTVDSGVVTHNINIALQPMPKPKPSGISGTVTDSVTHAPIAWAMVGVWGGQACTDSNGNYEIDHLRAGKYVVYAQARGYEHAVYPETVVVADSQITTGIDFALQPLAKHNGAISGEVTDSLGNVIPHVMVMASSPNFSATVMQGDKGYTVSRLPAGNYWVSAMARGYEPGSYPDSVTVVEGQTTENIDFTLTAAPPITGGISGTVTNAENGNPIMFAMVWAQGSKHMGRATTDSLGDYVVEHLADGSYAVAAFARGFVPSAVETVVVAGGQITTGINFSLEPKAPPTFGVVAGAVTDSATGNGIPHALVFAWGDHGQAYGWTDSLGNYVLQHVRTGTYVARARAKGYYPATYPESLTVAANETLAGINFSLAPLTPMSAGFAGFAFDGMGQVEIAGAHITAIGTSGAYDAYANAYGDYIIDNLPSGDYYLQAQANGYTVELSAEPVHVDPLFISAFTSEAVYALTGVQEPSTPKTVVGIRLTVGPNPFHGQTTVHYSLPKAGNISLKLYDVTGKLVSTVARGYVDAGSYAATINSHLMASGVYLIRFETNTTHIAQKLIVR